MYHRWDMPEEFRVWKVTTDNVTKRRKLESISEIPTNFRDKFSQRTNDSIDRRRIYVEEEIQRKKDAEDLKKSMKRVQKEQKKKANEERNAKAKEEREAKKKERAEKEVEERKARAERNAA